MRFASSQPNQPSIAAYFSLLSAICLFILPFLVPLHTEPGPTFYAEWLAIACGVGCFLALPGRTVALPRVALAPLGLMAAISLQAICLPGDLSSAASVAILYLLWAAVLMMCAKPLCDLFTPSRVVKLLMLAVLVAALINANSVIMFHAGLRSGPDMLFLRPDLRANLGQLNHLASLLWMGVASGLCLWRQSVSRSSPLRFAYTACLAPLLVASALTAAKAPLVYMVWLALLFWFFRQQALQRASYVVIAAYLLTLGLVHQFPLHEAMGGGDSIARVMSSASFSGDSNVRLGLMATAGRIAWAHPLLGAGWASFGIESYQLAGPASALNGVAEHAHQLFFQLAAEMGLIVPLLIAGILLLWLLGIRQWRGESAAVMVWPIGAAGIVLLHAQVEYPLWYAHFLGVCAFLVGLTERRVYLFSKLKFSWVSICLICFTSSFLLWEAMRDYRTLETWMAHDRLATKQERGAEYYAPLAAFSQRSLMSDKSIQVLAAAMAPTPDLLAEKRTVCMIALKNEAQRPTVFTCVLLDEMAGDQALAERNWRQALWVFRDDAPAYLDNLLATMPPDVLKRQQRLIDIARSEMSRPVVTSAKAAR